MTESDRIAQAYRQLETGAGSRYDLSNRGNQLILAERRRLTRALLEDAGLLPLASRRVLEVGSGAGSELAWLLELGAAPADLLGIDLLEDRVAAARRAYPGLAFRVENAEHIDAPDATFDLVMALTLFTSILDAKMAANVASEIVRVLTPGGSLLWYDFRYDNPANRNVRGVSERRVRELFPQLAGPLRTLTVMPPIVRRLGPIAPAAYPVLAMLPPMHSHVIGLLRKPG